MAMLDGTQGGVARAAWYALHTRSQYERRVRDGITRAKIEAYLPLYEERTRWSDRTLTTERVLFPGYCFGRFRPEDRRHVLGVAGVVRILGFGAQLIPVPDIEIESVRRLIDSGLPVIPLGPITAGRRVRVEDGALKGLEGIVIRLRSAWRVVVEVPLLGRNVAAELDTYSLTPLFPPLKRAA